MKVTDQVPGWTEEASVKVKLFDLQHQHLFKLIDRLETAMREGRGKQQMEEFLSDVADYAWEHFATEEAVMKAYDFPGRQTHTQEHRQAEAMVAKFRDQAASGDPALSVHVLHSLKEWVSRHVQGTDKMYTEFLNARCMC